MCDSCCVDKTNMSSPSSVVPYLPQLTSGPMALARSRADARQSQQPYATATAGSATSSGSRGGGGTGGFIPYKAPETSSGLAQIVSEFEDPRSRALYDYRQEQQRSGTQAPPVCKSTILMTREDLGIAIGVTVLAIGLMYAQQPTYTRLKTDAGEPTDVIDNRKVLGIAGVFGGGCLGLLVLSRLLK